MAGLVPAIHVAAAATVVASKIRWRKSVLLIADLSAPADVDARDKPGHDSSGVM